MSHRPRPRGSRALVDAAEGGQCTAPASPEGDARLFDDSLLAPGVDLALDTPVAFLYGGQDRSGPVPLGISAAEAIRAAGTEVPTIEIVPEAPHSLHSEAHGAARVQALLEAHCHS